MKNLKKIVKQDLVNKLDKKIEFDTSKLSANPKRKVNILKPILITCTCTLVGILLVPVVALAMVAINIDDSFKASKKVYTIHEINNLENNSFKALNNVSYPSSNLKNNIIDEAFINGFNEFSFDIILKIIYIMWNLGWFFLVQKRIIYVIEN